MTLHVPLTTLTKNLVRAEELAMMRPGSLLINTCRGGVVNEEALVAALRAGRLVWAAVDIFNEEPYNWELVNIDSCLITPHIGSMSVDCRVRMECGAAANAVAFLGGKLLDGLVPEAEYEMRASEKTPEGL